MQESNIIKLNTRKVVDWKHDRVIIFNHSYIKIRRLFGESLT